MPKFAKPLKGKYKLRNLEIVGYCSYYQAYLISPKKLIVGNKGHGPSKFIYLRCPNSRRKLCMKLENVSEIN